MVPQYGFNQIVLILIILKIIWTLLKYCNIIALKKLPTLNIIYTNVKTKLYLKYGNNF